MAKCPSKLRSAERADRPRRLTPGPTCPPPRVHSRVQQQPCPLGPPPSWAPRPPAAPGRCR
ncbi:MAG: hypothetical protein MZV64_73300 [Ignavibacteriales bacterium]|nr:hypothetical protein [Ignavibacteriales bacterium]